MKGQISSNLFKFLKKDTEEILKKVKEELEREREVKINHLLKYYSTKSLKEEIDFGKRFKENKSIIELDVFLNNELKIIKENEKMD